MTTLKTPVEALNVYVPTAYEPICEDHVYFRTVGSAMRVIKQHAATLSVTNSSIHNTLMNIHSTYSIETFVLKTLRNLQHDDVIADYPELAATFYDPTRPLRQQFMMDVCKARKTKFEVRVVNMRFDGPAVQSQDAGTNDPIEVNVKWDVEFRFTTQEPPHTLTRIMDGLEFKAEIPGEKTTSDWMRLPHRAKAVETSGCFAGLLDNEVVKPREITLAYYIQRIPLELHG